MWRLRYLFILLLLVASFASPSPQDRNESHHEEAGPCAYLGEPILIPLSVHVIFAGFLPAFMREPTYNSSSFLAQLSSAASAPTSNYSSVTIGSCAKVKLSFRYSLGIAPRSVVHALDSALRKQLSSSETRYISAVSAALLYRSAIRSAHIPRGASTILLHNAIAGPSSSIYGYINPVDGGIDAIGRAPRDQFAFVDIAARPHAFDDSHPVSPGQALLSIARDSLTYAKRVHALVSRLLVLPPVRFAAIKPMQYLRVSVHEADAGNLTTVAGPPGNGTGKVFESGRLSVLLESALCIETACQVQVKHRAIPHGSSSASSLGIGIAFAGRSRERRFVLNGTILVRQAANEICSNHDTSSNDNARYLCIISLSFADAYRKPVFFHQGEERNIHSESINDSMDVVIILRGAWRSELDEQPYDEALVVAHEVLSLVSGLDPEELSIPGSDRETLGVIVREAVKRAIILSRLRKSSEQYVVRALEALTYDGFEKRSLAYISGLSVRKRRSSVIRNLNFLFRAWQGAAHKWDFSGLKDGELALQRATEELSHHLSERTCNESVAKDLLRDVDMARKLVQRKVDLVNWFTVVVITAFAAGIAAGCKLHYAILRWKSKKNGIPLVRPSAISKSTTETQPTKWFSTFQRPSKSIKVN